MRIRADGAALDRPPLEPASRQQAPQGKVATGPRQWQQQEQIAQLQSPPDKDRTGPAQAPLQAKLTGYADIEASARSSKFSWKKLRTDTGNDDASKKTSAEGLRAETTAGTKLRTRIKWKPVHGSAGEGTGMDATILGPDHKLGSEPQAGSSKIWNKRRVALAKAAGGEKYIAGHLLNNNLGGPGDDARNLTAIPATANTTQSARIEEQVKNHVNTELQFLHYKVDVDYAQSSGSPKLWYASKLTSAWTAVDKDGADAGATRTATISIPSPEGLKGGSEVDYGDNKKSIDSGAAAKAKHEPTKHVVLNNQGYLRVAVIVQTHFRKTLEDLQVALTSNEKSLGNVSDERDSLQQRFDELSDQMNETEQLLKETELELKQKAEGLDLLQAENRELHKELGALSLKAAEDQATIERLRARLARARQRNKELEQENERLQLELAERQRSSVPLEELASGRGVQEAVARDLAFREQHAEKLDALGTDDEFARLLDQGRQLLASSRVKVASLKPSGPKQAPQDPDLV